MSELRTASLDHQSLIEYLRELKQSIDDAYIEIVAVGGRYLQEHADEDGQALVLEVSEFIPEMQPLIMIADIFCERDIPEAIRYTANHMTEWIQDFIKIMDKVAGGDYEGVDPEIVAELLKLMPYDEYLKSPHWKTVRTAALDRAGHRCQVCNTNKEQLHVHHRTYENRGKEKPEDVIVLCATCHRTFHQNGRLAK